MGLFVPIKDFVGVDSLVVVDSGVEIIIFVNSFVCLNLGGFVGVFVPCIVGIGFVGLVVGVGIVCVFGVGVVISVVL